MLTTVEPIFYSIPIETDDDEELSKNFAESLTKIRAWELPFDKIVFLDADTLVMANSDELFSQPQLSGVLDDNQNRKDS
jgi:alpha-N-acetylglucosamine transferase